MGAPVRIQIVDQPDVFGLEHVRIDEVAETYGAVRCRGRVLPNVRPSCPACGDGRKPSVHDYYVHEIADTPMRGRKTILELEFPRFRHRCGQTLDGPRPSFLHRDLNATKRLVRYVEGQTFRRPVLDISREVGLPEPEVRKLASKLAHRLHHRHRFPTPAVLAIDDLHIRRRLYTVVTDAISGRAIALVEGGTYEAVRDELRRRDFDFAAVRCIVTDMSGSNKKVVERLFKTVGAVHVADKWHVLRYAQKALARVISQEISRLEKPKKGTPPNEVAEMKAKAATIRDARRQLMGSRLKDPNEKQGKLKLDKIGPVTASNQRISAAFWSKIRLHQAYAALTREDAIKLMLSYGRRAHEKSIREEMLPALKHIWKHRQQILAYWSARWPDGSLIRPTTGPTERRNGSIRKIWRSAHGFRKHALFELRALYEPWTLDVDIILCAEPHCYAAEGPSGSRARLFAPVQEADDIRCSDHR